MWKIPDGVCKTYQSHGPKTTCSHLLTDGKSLCFGTASSFFCPFDVHYLYVEPTKILTLSLRFQTLINNMYKLDRTSSLVPLRFRCNTCDIFRATKVLQYVQVCVVVYSHVIMILLQPCVTILFSTGLCQSCQDNHVTCLIFHSSVLQVANKLELQTC